MLRVIGRSIILESYLLLQSKEIMVSKVTEYSNRFLRVIKYEYESKPSAFGLKEISKLFKDALSVSERGNVIMVVYKI